jgi:endonuclease YncB( thermonuclease family)
MRAFLTFVLTAVIAGATWRLSGCSTASDIPTIKGPVVSVIDGDTLVVLQDQQRISIRLVEIDAPDRGQPFGKASTESLAALCATTMARVKWNNVDAYNRILGRVWCGGVDANKEQVRRGMAWVYDDYVTDRSLYRVQDAAKAAAVGLWSHKVQVPPWEWRRIMQQNSRGILNGTSSHHFRTLFEHPSDPASSSSSESPWHPTRLMSPRRL